MASVSGSRSDIKLSASSMRRGQKRLHTNVVAVKLVDVIAITRPDGLPPDFVLLMSSLRARHSHTFSSCLAPRSLWGLLFVLFFDPTETIFYAFKRRELL